MTKQERQREACRKWRAKNLERERERARANNTTRKRDWKKEAQRVSEKYRTKEGWAKYMLINLRHRAKKRGLPFDLEESDLIFPDVCPVLHIPIFVGRGRGPRINNNSPSVDRFSNLGGYTKDNIRIISMRANQLKSDASSQELQAVLDYMNGR